MRDAMRALEARGVNDNVADLLRVGVAAMVRHCCDAYDRRGNVSPAWLAKAVRDGGVWPSVKPAADAGGQPDDGLAERDRRRLASMDELMAQAGLSL